MNLGNIIPTKFIIDNQTYTSGSAQFSTNFELAIVSHNLSVVRVVAAPMENDSDEPLFLYRIVGMMTVNFPEGHVNTGDGTFTLGTYMEFEPFTVVNGFCSSAISNYSRNIESKTQIHGFSGVITDVIDNGQIDRLAGSLNLCGCVDDTTPNFSDMSTSFRLF